MYWYYIRNLHNIEDKVLSVSPQMGKDAGRKGAFKTINIE